MAREWLEGKLQGEISHGGPRSHWQEASLEFPFDLP
jgi:hypothetical protein